MPPHVIIVGAGLTGPALAIALARQSIRSTIVERHPSPRNIGGVILLAVNALRVLDKAVGVEPLLRKAGYSYDAINIYTEGNNALDKVGGFLTTNAGIKGITIKRPILHDILLDRCTEFGDMIEIKYGTKIVEIDEQPDHVEAVMEDGSRLRGDIMIGADGIGSIVRPHVLAGRPGPVNFSGAVSISCMVDRKDVNFPSDLVLPAFLYTRSGTILVFALDPEGQKLQWATSIKVPERPRSEWEEYRTSGQAVADIKRDWDRVKMDPVRSMLDHLDQDNVRLWAPYQVADLPTWHTDRVCLLGDAAHAIPPSAGQGAAQGFEDVGVLSRMLTSSRNNYKEAFEKYELARRPRIDMVRKMTAGAEGTRAKTSSSLTWWVKRNIICVDLQVLGYGKKGYLEGTALNAYDATTA